MSTQLELIPLYSSSKGNSTLLSINDTYILVDCGMSCKKINEALTSVDVCADDIAAVFLTHCHSDHISGMEVFAKKYHTDVYATEGTLRALPNLGDFTRVNVISENDIVNIGTDIEVRSFPTPHDATGSVCYKIMNKRNGMSASVMTDLGCFSDGMKGFAGGSDIVLLESNYDCKMLRNGPYPYSLQQRISAGHGHISNEECARSADSLIRLGSRRFVLGHLSPNNNTEELAITSFVDYLGSRGYVRNRDYEVQVASKIHPSEGYSL
ncbi:MAG: MBL fold metallo-hydrolase [Saccharofermentans sp.]|jgi:phosphoribosyl 1,2-cyclic phosphodiesterase|nr:MBL fold metallo-hydrolase [Mageeibacillus sp.]MCI1264371.1 MBL fold metallo-hydrolase [Saccharofermentans sp.]MCI1275798.1 MBL fold metallo-hydrolase [Saccharofermentans sp.]MCI1769559.1 MBL fold metallo-hydrolase [Mageeibacillus sp.]MCI2044352.1 MBL fold metallo-hydrolase [Mageeibacillus sp.]